MTPSKASVFPHTIFDANLVTPLLAIFDTLLYLQASENKTEAPASGSDHIQTLLQSSSLEYLAIAPLNEELARFTSLVHDLHTRGEEYMQQLASLSIAQLHGAQNETKQSIIGFLTDTTTNKPQTSTKSMLLWQARLYLKLAEFYDREQNVISSQLDSVLEKQGDLFSELRDETDASFALTEEISSSSRDNSRLMMQRLKAWSQLFCLGDEKLRSDLHIFITDQPDLYADVVDRNSSGSIFDAQPSLHINLPAMPDISSSSPDYKQETALLINELFDAGNSMEQKERAVAGWNNLMEKLGPSPHGFDFQLFNKSGFDIFRDYCGDRSLEFKSDRDNQEQVSLVGLLTF